MIPSISITRLSDPGADSRPLLVLGPSLGTTAATLWSACADELADEFDIVAWDLPGHGTSIAPAASFSLAELATAVLAVVDGVLAQRCAVGDSFAYAGDSVGGAVGLQLLLDAPARVSAAVILCSGAKIGDAHGWESRITQVRQGGTSGLVAGSRQRWFAPGFLDRCPARAAALLEALEAADDVGYARACEALADFDVRDRLGEITVPMLAVAGAADVVTPTASLSEIATGVADGRLVVLPGTAHLAPAEDPVAVAALIRGHLRRTTPPEPAVPQLGGGRHEAGLAVRRQVLGDAHVERSLAGASDFTRDFQEFITDYAWGGIWTRPGLDRRSRSLITLTALVAGGHHEELAMHVRAARRNGLSVGEIRECLLQSAVYCGVPAANMAFRIAAAALDEFESEETQ